MSTGNPCKVGAIVGGAQKAGTTSLSGYLGQHPELHAPRRKELHFFDNESIDWSDPDYELLHRCYDGRVGERTSFEVTPIYLFWPPSPERIHRYNPEMKLIFSLRDPIERAWSHWRMEVGRGNDRLPFHRAIREGRERLSGTATLDRAWRLYSYVERGFYARQVRRLLGFFPRESVLFIRSADLRVDHPGCLDAIARFLDLGPFPSLPARSDFPSSGTEHRLRAEDVAYLRDIFSDDVRELAELTGLSVADWPTMDEGARIEA